MASPTDIWGGDMIRKAEDYMDRDMYDMHNAMGWHNLEKMAMRYGFTVDGRSDEVIALNPTMSADKDGLKKVLAMYGFKASDTYNNGLYIHWTRNLYRTMNK